MSVNHGISITGGTVSAQAMAAGTGASATSTSGGGQAVGLDDLRRELHALVELLRTRPEGVAPEQVTVAELAEQEAAKPEPSRAGLLGYLEVLKSGAGSAAAVAAAVTAVQSTVAALL